LFKRRSGSLLKISGWVFLARAPEQLQISADAGGDCVKGGTLTGAQVPIITSNGATSGQPA
jgi:hypothetical protein